MPRCFAGRSMLHVAVGLCTLFVSAAADNSALLFGPAQADMTSVIVPEIPLTGSALSITLWMKIDTHQTWHELLILEDAWHDLYWADGVFFRTENEGGSVPVWWVGTQRHRFSALQIPLNVWTFVAISVDGASATAYVNGASQTRSVTAATLRTFGFNQIGGDSWAQDTANAAMVGGLDNVQLWNRALSSGEIGDIMTTGTTADLSDLAASWCFNGADATLLTDSSGNDRHAFIAKPAKASRVPISTIAGTGSELVPTVCPAPEAEDEEEAVPCLDENGMPVCHLLAYCVSGTCECQPGTRDVSPSQDGTDCDDTGFAVRFVLNTHLDDPAERRTLRRGSNPSLFTNADVIGVYCDTDAEGWFLNHVDTDLTGRGVTFTEVMCIYADEPDATAKLGYYASAVYPDGATITAGPGVYRWVLPTTGNPIQIPPTGMTLDSVHFSTSCALSGCWVLKGVVTTGENLWRNNAFNTFFLPYAVGSHSLSYDFDYSAGGNSVGGAVEWTFSPANHPCAGANFEASNGNTQEVTSCCISNAGVGELAGAGGSKGGFLANYRPSSAFATWASALEEAACADPNDSDIIQRRGYLSESTGLEAVYDVAFPAAIVETFLQGQFQGMTDSPGVYQLDLADPFFGQYTYEIHLDEVELRTKAGKLTGTVGVEHTVDTFLGLANFRTTGLVALDTFATQVSIHLEKTSFFSVSTHGVNDYTFLEYVNMRLVAVYQKDEDFSGTDESGARTVRTSTGNQANYVQVTFTLGSQYNVDPAGSSLIPLDSVRAGHGVFFDEAADDILHMCTLYGNDGEDSRFDATSPGDLAFADLLTQDCAPSAAMCSSPSAIPDSFVVFNIPLGMDYFNGAAGGPSATLSNNIFVDMVVSATEAHQGGANPNDGGEPMQMKTTLTGSIPIVEGGINIFCDGFTAKTDLQDVADADIVVGSASTAEELTRLRIMKDIASTQLNPNEITQIDSDSIEAGLMTLVLKGNASYFGLSGRSAVRIELEDVITIHIMEDSGSGVGTGKDSFVLDKLNDAPDDNLDSNGLKTEGYCLNGAFCFEIDRPSQRAHLEPTADLLAECPFNPPRPDPGISPLETCVTRRDVRYREFPARTGAYSTAMELCTGGKGGCGEMSDEQWFFSTIFGNNDYAKSLATSYANVIANEYDLNGVYRRAFWINPGYEWTPTQTGGTPIFSVSQKLYLFALITLDEGLTDPANTGSTLGYDSPVLPGARRRMLLQSTPSNVDEALQDGQSEVGGGVFEFRTSPTQLMSKTFDVPEDRVATFKVQMQLTEAEVCMSTTELQASLRATLDDYLSGSASPYHTVQVLTMAVDKAGARCRRRSIRSLLSSFSAATADLTMLVVFKEGQDAAISVAKLEGMSGVQSVEPISVSAKVNTAVEETWVFSPDADAGSEKGGSLNVGAVAGAAAGGVLALAILVGGLLAWRQRSAGLEVAEAVQTVRVEDLKQQLASEC